VILWCCIIGYGVILWAAVWFSVLDINVLNYCYFHSDCLTFLKNEKRWKNKKNVKKRVFYRKIKNVYKRLLQLWLYVCVKLTLDSFIVQQIILIAVAINKHYQHIFTHTVCGWNSCILAYLQWKKPWIDAALLLIDWINWSNGSQRSFHGVGARCPFNSDRWLAAAVSRCTACALCVAWLTHCAMQSCEPCCQDFTLGRRQTLGIKDWSQVK